MLCALYAYKGSYAKTLAFKAGERFLEIGHSKDPNWMHVISENGLIGYIPKNYVASEQISPLQMIELIDISIKRVLDIVSSSAREYTSNENEALQRLDELRNEWIVKIPAPPRKKRPPPQPPNFQNGQNTLNESNHEEEIIEEEATSFMERGKSLDPPDEYNFSKQNKDQHCHKSGSESGVSRDAIYFRKLVEEVRAKTNVSFATSHEVVEIILKSLGKEFPAIYSTVDSLLNSRGDDKTCPKLDWEDSVDGRTLIEYLEKLRQCKDDEQQRSWALFEDEAIILQFLYKILDILNEGDSDVCRAVLCLDDFRALLTLVQYYQMETRWPLRKLLLQIFGCICQLSEIHISYFSASVLSTELSREIQDTESTAEQLGYVVLVLGMILSMGDTLPYTHFSFMDCTFIENLFFNMEKFNKSPETDHLCEKYLCLILAFNLQYHRPVRGSSSGRNNMPNLVIKVLSNCKEANFFIEKLLVLFNREEDPVSMFDFGIRSVNSVMCMMKDIYRNKKTAAHLYTNDEKVVCDILLRQLTDLPFDDKRHYDYLKLLEGVLVNGKWAEHKHLRKEMYSRLVSICAQNEDTPHRDTAKQVINVMRNCS